MSKEKQIEQMAKLNAINEMKAVIRSKTVSCESCEFYKNGICDDACELEEDNNKICTDLYNAGYRKQSEGEWKMKVYPITSCSVCGVLRNVEHQQGWNFCPRCGAKMKGGDDNE